MLSLKPIETNKKLSHYVIKSYIKCSSSKKINNLKLKSTCCNTPLNIVWKNKIVTDIYNHNDFLQFKIYNKFYSLLKVINVSGKFITGYNPRKY